MENIRIKEIVEACGGRLLCGDENKCIKDFAIDSREGNEDSIFVPIIGERVDAHRFIDGALKLNGATFTSEHDSADGEKPWIRVDDTVDAMQKVGTYYRNRLDLPVVAVTGSVGKTTTREMIATVLSSQKKVFQTRGNQNSQIGVPLTLAHMSKEDDVAVLEIGMSERGQIEKLTSMIRPNIAVVTVIGVSHIAQLKSQENICQEKMDIIKGLPADGKVFLNGDDSFLASYAGKLDYDTYFYGMGENCDYRAEDFRFSGGRSQFTFVYKDQGQEKRIPVTLGSLGEHNVRNSLAGLGIAHQMGLDMELACKILADFKGQRLNRFDLASCILLDDAYNASPDSMKASVKVLSEMEGVTGRRIAGLADMLELGDNEKAYHYETGSFIAGTGIDEVAAYGPLSKELLKGVQDGLAELNKAGTEGSGAGEKQIKLNHFETREELEQYLLDTIKPGDALLLKGSNGMKLSAIVAAFKDRDQDQDQ